MTEATSQQQIEFVFIPVDGKQTKNVANTPPANLKVEFPPKFTDSELGRTHDKKGAGKSKKPPNAFILFRKKYVESLHRLGHHDAMKKVSGWARDAWNKLSQPEKDQYEHFANRAASLYQEWEIRNPQPNNNRQKPKSRRVRNQNSRQIVSAPTISMPAHIVSPKSSPESIPEMFDYDSRNFSIETFPTFENIYYYNPSVMYESPIIPDFLVNLDSSCYPVVPPLTEIQPANNFYDDIEYYLPTPKEF
jgi:hypothetical protein